MKAVWDNTNVYLDFSDPAIASHEQFVDLVTAELNRRSPYYKNVLVELENQKSDSLFTNIEEIVSLYRKYLDAFIHVSTIHNYSSTAISINTKNEVAKNLQDRINKRIVELSNAIKPIHLAIVKAPIEFVNQFLNDPRVSELKFSLSKERFFADHLLSVEGETLMSSLSIDGLQAWGKLYDSISGSLKVEFNGEFIGLAKANNFYTHPERENREKAFRGINKAWKEQEVSANAILNSINGWRNENYKLRSTKKPLHFLDRTCHSANITRNTLEALMTAASEKKEVGQKVINLMASELNIDKCAPWDLMAPAPYMSSKNKKITYPEAIVIIKTAFNEVSPEMANFAQMMFDKKWIDGELTENRAQGAYCTGFVRLKEPRVFMTFDGSMKNVITLAHEIGHAFHNWSMRDLPMMECMYPMTLAETASIFAETVVRDYLLKNSQSKEEALAICWQEIQSIQSLIINIPSRFEFEKNFVEMRLNKFVSIEETKNLMINAQKKWYGSTLSEYDEMFWASKLHFSMAGRSFYNYPYLFGYLFSLGIYAQKESLGQHFYSSYISLLRDTGRMNAQDLVEKYFNQSIEKKDFWLASIEIAEKSFSQFNKLLKT